MKGPPTGFAIKNLDLITFVYGNQKLTFVEDASQATAPRRQSNR